MFQILGQIATSRAAENIIGGVLLIFMVGIPIIAVVKISPYAPSWIRCIFSIITAGVILIIFGMLPFPFHNTIGLILAICFILKRQWFIDWRMEKRGKKIGRRRRRIEDDD